MTFMHEADLPLPLEAVDLGQWLSHMTEADYMACAKGHRALGTNRDANLLGMVNVESMAGSLIIQHYQCQQLAADHLVLFSEASRGYLLHLVPFCLNVRWEMRVVSISPESSKLWCSIDVRNPGWVRLAGIFVGANHWIRKHLIEETYGFARDLTRKGGR